VPRFTTRCVAKTDIRGSILPGSYADIPGSGAKTSYFFLNTMHKVKILKIWRVVCQERAYFTTSLCNAGLENL